YPKKIAGDDLYIMRTHAVYVSRDSGVTWNVDTAGLNCAYITDICLDKNQNVYLATYGRGLFMQAPKGNTWTKLSAAPSSLTKVYIDAKGNIFVASFNKFYESKDGGTTFPSFRDRKSVV